MDARNSLNISYRSEKATVKILQSRVAACWLVIVPKLLSFCKWQKKIEHGGDIKIRTLKTLKGPLQRQQRCACNRVRILLEMFWTLKTWWSVTEAQGGGGERGGGGKVVTLLFVPTPYILAFSYLLFVSQFPNLLIVYKRSSMYTGFAQKKNQNDRW